MWLCIQFQRFAIITTDTVHALSCCANYAQLYTDTCMLTQSCCISSRLTATNETGVDRTGESGEGGERELCTLCLLQK